MIFHLSHCWVTIMYKDVKVTICKCKYCGSWAALIDDIGKCPKGCPGHFSIIAEVPGLIEKVTQLVDSVDANIVQVGEICPKCGELKGTSANWQKGAPLI